MFLIYFNFAGMRIAYRRTGFNCDNLIIANAIFFLMLAKIRTQYALRIRIFFLCSQKLERNMRYAYAYTLNNINTSVGLKQLDNHNYMQ